MVNKIKIYILDYDSDIVAAIGGGLKVGFSNLPEMYSGKLLDLHYLEALAGVTFEIRDENIGLLIEKSKINPLELENHTKDLYRRAEQESQFVEKASIIVSIKKNIYLFKNTFHEENPEYDKK